MSLYALFQPFRRPYFHSSHLLYHRHYPRYYTGLIVSRILLLWPPANPTTSLSPVFPPHFQSAPSAHSRRSIPLTVSRSPLPRPTPCCRCLPTSTNAQRLRFVRRKAYCRKWPGHSGLLQTTRWQSNGRASSPHARSCRYPRMKPFTALF